MCNIDELTRSELMSVVSQAMARLNHFRPLRIKTTWKRCGRSGCPCADGPADGTWGNLHGPYVYAHFADRYNPSRRTLSLGRYFSGDDIEAEREKQSVEWLRFYTITPEKREAMTQDKKDKCWRHRHLSIDEYSRFYGVSVEDDNMDRPVVFYISNASYSAYKAKLRAVEEVNAALDSGWCEKYGIGKPEGQRLIEDLLKDDYYLVD